MLFQRHVDSLEQLSSAEKHKHKIRFRPHKVIESSRTSSVPSLCCSDESDEENLKTTPLGSCKRVRFDGLVCVREFESYLDLGQLWYSRQDVARFKYINEWERRERKGNGKQYDSSRRSVSTQKSRDREERSLRNSETVNITPQQQLLWKHVRNVLVVDRHDIVLQLLSRMIRDTIPHATIETATSTMEAGTILKSKSFDVVLVEERLSLFRTPSTSGSAFLAEHARALNNTLFIGLCAQVSQDGDLMKSSGADLVWEKPLASLDSSMINDVLTKILAKRQ